MKPIEFEGQNGVFAKDQPEYLPLPGHITKEGVVTSCWKLSVKERLQILLHGKIWFHTHTFNHPLQPQLPSTTRILWE
jgi:hypothetical protein